MNILQNLLFLLVGAIIGNILALGRDQRKEYNECADPLRTRLRKEWKEFGPMSVISDEEFRELIDRAYFWEKKGLKAQYDKYLKAKSDYNPNSVGEPVYNNKENVRAEIEKLIKKIYRK